MKNIVVLALITMMAAIVATRPAAAQSAQTYWVYDGRSLSVVQRDPSTVQAKEWAAFYFRKSAPAGTMSQRWGIDTGQSAADVLRKVKENQRFERQFERWCQCSWGENTTFNVIAPVVSLSKGWVLLPDDELSDPKARESGQKLHAMVDRL